MMVPICAKCADDRQKNPCYHSDEERMLIGTWVTFEIYLDTRYEFIFVKSL